MNTLARRVYPNAGDEPGYIRLEAGEYGKDSEGRWFARVPSEAVFGPIWLNNPENAWTVQEHNDGTVSVSPSIHSIGPNNETLWHGFLRRGVWEEC